MSRGSIRTDADGALRLADAVTARRMELGHTSARALARAMEIDYRTITALESCSRSGFDRSTLAKFEMFFGWPPGYTRRLMEGSAPVEPAPEPEQPQDVPQSNEHRIYVLYPADLPDDVLDLLRAAVQHVGNAVIATYERSQQCPTATS